MEGIRPDIGLKDLCRGSVEAGKLHISDPNRVWPLSSMLIANLKAAYPDLTNQYLQQNCNLKLFNNMVGIGICINDTFDLSRYTEDHNRLYLIEDTYQLWQILASRAKEAANSPEDKNILRQYERETVCVEEMALKKEYWNPSEIIEYREVTNAIALANLASVLVGSERIGHELSSTQEISYEDILRRYAWIRDGRYANENQRKLIGIFNVLMAIQTIDDANDRGVDLKLGLHTFATDFDSSHLRSHYLCKAKENGISSEAISGQLAGFRAMKGLLNLFPQIGGARERLFSK